VGGGERDKKGGEVRVGKEGKRAKRRRLVQNIKYNAVTHSRVKTGRWHEIQMLLQCSRNFACNIFLYA
jgi:hypothetical protein